MAGRAMDVGGPSDAGRTGALAPKPAGGARMRALRKNVGEPGATLVDVPVPVPGPGEVRIRVARASICGTDIHIWKWNDWARERVRPPLTLGHECAGTVDAVGPGVAGVAPGARVALETHVTCGRCMPCRSGQAHACTRVEILGVDRDGVFADYVVVPAVNVFPVPDGVAFDQASLLEPFGNAVHTALAQPLTARTVLVLGLGPTGLGAVGTAHAAGAAKVVGLDPVPERRAMALRFGAGAVIDPGAGDPGEELARLKGADGFDVVLEMSGSPQALSLGLSAIRHGGEMALLGLPSGPVTLDLAEDVIMRGLTVRGITGRRLWETWYAASRLVAGGHVDLGRMVTHRFPLERMDEAFVTASSGRSGKVLVEIAPNE